MNLGAPRPTQPCRVSRHCLIARRKTKAGDNGRSAEKAPNNPNNDSFRIYRCGETPNHSAGEAGRAAPCKEQTALQLNEAAAIVSPLWSISPRLKTTPRMSDANMGIISVKTKRQTPKVNKKNKYQTSKKKNLLFSASVGDKDHWVIVHLHTTSWVALEASMRVKTWRYGGQDSTPRRRGFCGLQLSVFQPELWNKTWPQKKWSAWLHHWMR